MSRTAVEITQNNQEREILWKVHTKRSVPEFMKHRIQVVLAAAHGRQNKDIAATTGLEVHFIGNWRKRFANNIVIGNNPIKHYGLR